MRDHQTTKLAEDFIYLEAPKWRGDRLWMSDVFDRKLCRIGLNGEREHICDVAGRPSGIAFLKDGTALVVSSENRRLYKVVDNALVEYADLTPHTNGDVNDLTVDSADRLYVGDFGYDLFAGEELKPTVINRVDPDGTITPVADGVEFPNAMVIINGGKTLVVAETWASRLTAFDLSEDGTLSNRRLFADLGHRQPDGICADAEGAIWIASFNTGEFIRVLDGGTFTDRAAHEGIAVACTIGGPDGKTLFCTVYGGTLEDVIGGKRLGSVHAVTVDVGAP